MLTTPDDRRIVGCELPPALRSLSGREQIATDMKDTARHDARVRDLRLARDSEEAEKATAMVQAARRRCQKHAKKR